MTNWTMDDLETWDARIQDKVAAFGLDCYPQEFEVCDQNAMIGYMAYHGMPSHYPHWSYGKSFEMTKTGYDYGVSGLPYEMVINSDPCLAYLMRDNSLCLQILTIAHVYGHNDFFKTNFNFKTATRASETIASFKTRADRVRSYIEDPSIGSDAVELFLDAAHALSLNRDRNPAIRKQSRAEQKRWIEDRAEPPADPFAHLKTRAKIEEPDLRRHPLIPDPDLLLFIRDNRPDLALWQKDLLTIVDEEAQYFMPQIDTKIMNEGWASYWHHRIMTSLDLPQEIALEFIVRHNQVICPHPGGLNPYHVGFMIFKDLETKHGGPDSEAAIAKLYEVRETERDTSFLRRYLTPELMHDLDLFAYKARGDHLVVTDVSDEEGCETVKRKLLTQIGTGGIPMIKVKDADHGGSRGLYCVHDHDGRDLDLVSAEKTLGHLRKLWGNTVYLETILKGNHALLTDGPDGFDAKVLS